MVWAGVKGVSGSHFHAPLGIRRRVFGAITTAERRFRGDSVERSIEGIVSEANEPRDNQRCQDGDCPLRRPHHSATKVHRSRIKLNAKTEKNPRHLSIIITTSPSLRLTSDRHAIRRLSVSRDAIRYNRVTQRGSYATSGQRQQNLLLASDRHTSLNLGEGEVA